MIVVRAPLRLSFVGGGTDLPVFYTKYPGRVISTTIGAYVYIVVNRTTFINEISVRYSVAERVRHPSELKHTRVRAALMEMGITRGIEIASFADMPAKTGLGSSSSFSVALMKALHMYQGENISPRRAAEAACRLEIDLIKEPVGKQDQYAAAYGGFNVFEFNEGSVSVAPLSLDHRLKISLEQHLALFFTGITRDASSVLVEQTANTEKKFEILKEMSDSVFEFRDNVMRGNIRRLGEMLHEGWMRKKQLASSISSSVIDTLYETGINSGAWGGKVLGAGGGGCIAFLVSQKYREEMRRKIIDAAETMNLNGFKEINVPFTQCGTEILSSDRGLED
ncbi:MAG: hypothetical protein A3A04_00555 [Candidatus Harrisonbacteria bacterium RIFCSPLOWO2_01_FULL_40_28]|uniref:GHMP kinase n=2 Tax=Candidatus Harrisoniibacteriota TaxID=1817905 RepID=A0A1G1ZN24_9BACT|nr:MAG: hypothetical protein A3A04_00555 [Candidatus Harrisonbacteria bacterium RIFCSPLOWO2_01_FULL_40_28]